MKLKIEIILGEYRKHTRDQYFSLLELRRDICFYSHDSNTLKLKIKRRDKWFCDFDVDITGWIFDFIVKVNPTDEDADALINLHVTDLTEPIEGKTDIDLTAPTGIEYLGSYVYQLQGTNIHGKKQLLCEGIISFKQSLFGE